MLPDMNTHCAPHVATWGGELGGAWLEAGRLAWRPLNLMKRWGPGPGQRQNEGDQGTRVSP